MFDFNVICFEKNGSTNLEYFIDGKTCIYHNNGFGDNQIAFTSVEDNNCKDVSLSESMHNDDQFVIKKLNKSISNTDLIFLSLIDPPVKQSFNKVFNSASSLLSIRTSLYSIIS